MKKIKLLGLSIIIIGLFFMQNHKLLHAFDFETVCQLPLTTFSDGSSTFDVSFPPGGGTTCVTIADCPKVSLPVNGTVFSIKVDMELTDPTSEIGTPYVWVPVSAGADANQIKQVDSSNCNIIKSYPTGTNPSRTFVIPGGDVWVGNRDSGNVTKLSPLTGNNPAGGTCGDGLCGTDETIYSCPADCTGNICGPAGTLDCREYEVMGNFATGSGPRGVTGDVNGNVWVGNNVAANMSKLDSVTGVKMIADIPTGGGPYGIVGDPFGHIWISNRTLGTLQCLDSTTGILTSVDSVTSPYGIGMGKDGSVYIASYSGGRVYKYNAVTGNCPGALAPSATYNTGTANGARGVAVDQNNYVWVSNSGSNRFYVFTDPATSFSVAPGGGNLLGAAIDFDGYGWTVSYASGDVYKYSFDGASLNLECSVNVSGNPYNYSDMTGLRTVPKAITVGGVSTPISDTGTFDICTDGTTTCADSAPCAAITALLSICVPNAHGNCEVPLEIFSMQFGDYTLKNLEVIYGKEVPVTTGGLVPCGRDWNDPETPWDDTLSCDLCFGIMLLNQGINFLLGIAGILAVLALIVTGILFTTSAGSSERKNNAVQALKWILIGFLIVFLSWLLIDFILSAWGYLDPIGGEWSVVCD